MRPCTSFQPDRHQYNTSPYTRKARLVLLEKSIRHEYLVDAPREPGSLAVRVNPLGRIPALILDDETCVFDSPVIAEYADTLNDTPILIPRTERIRPEDKQEAENIVRHNEAITRALAFAADQLGQREWCEGSSIALADLAQTRTPPAVVHCTYCRHPHMATTKLR